MTGTCVACGQVGLVERHHVTGRACPDGSYLDPLFIVELCKPCHDREHVAVRRSGLAWPQGAPLRHRLGRSADFLSRLIEKGRLPGWLAPIAVLLGETAQAVPEELSEAAP